MSPLSQELSSPPTQRASDPEATPTDTPPKRATPHAGPPPATTMRPATNGSTPKTNGKTPKTTTNGTPKPITPAAEPLRPADPPTHAEAPTRPEPPNHAHSSELAPAGRQVVSVAPVLFGAGLGVLVVLLGLPTLVLVWRSALASPLSPSGLVGGLLVLVGLVLLSVGGFTLVSGAARVEQDATAGRWAAILLRPSVLMALLGTVLLVCAALAVS